MKWSIGCVMTVMLLAGCGSSSNDSATKGGGAETSAPNTDSSDGADGSSASEGDLSKVDACSFLSKEEASALSGLDVTTVTPANAGKTAACSYFAEAREVALVYVYAVGTDLPLAGEPIPELGEKSSLSPLGAGIEGKNHTFQVSTGVAGGKLLTSDADRLPAHKALLLKVLENAGEI